MKLLIFLKRNNISLKPKIYQLCTESYHLLEKSGDNIHGSSHIDSMIQNLHYLIHDHEIKYKIDFNILLPAIYWHDVWIAGKKTTSLIKLIYYQLVEGIGSSILFKDYAQTVSLSRKLTRNITYAIRKHSSIQILPIFQIEAQILADLDKIELWNSKRFFNIQDNPLAKVGDIKKSLLAIYSLYSLRVGTYTPNLSEKLRKNVVKYWQNFAELIIR